MSAPRRRRRRTSFPGLVDVGGVKDADRGARHLLLVAARALISNLRSHDPARRGVGVTTADLGTPLVANLILPPSSECAARALAARVPCQPVQNSSESRPLFHLLHGGEHVRGAHRPIRGGPGSRLACYLRVRGSTCALLAGSPWGMETACQVEGAHRRGRASPSTASMGSESSWWRGRLGAASGRARSLPTHRGFWRACRRSAAGIPAARPAGSDPSGG